jgi:glyoxylase-like metal-dependent hydrolase (beta-lactamase superfamily II)
MNRPKASFQQIKLGVLALLFLNYSLAVFAGEKENSIIKKAVAAYGGDSLMGLESLQFTDTIKNFSQGQSGYSGQGPMSMQLSENKIEISLDLTNKRKVFKRATTRLVWSHSTDKPTVQHRIFSDGKGYIIDHALQQYRFVKGINFNNVDIGFSQWLDPLIIRQLAKDKNNSQWTDTVYIAGQAHDVLKVNKGTNQEYSVFLNQKNGYLTRMTKKQGQHLRSYDFIEHSQRQGITWAKQLFVSTAEQALYHTDSRELRFDLAQNDEFSIPSGYKPRPKTQAVDVSKLTIRKLAKGVYFVGQGWSYTLFIDAGDHYISAGAWQENKDTKAWLKGLALLRRTTGSDKPVTQHIVSHHHTDHMMGLNDVVDQGADLILHPGDIFAVKEHLQQPLADQRFMPIKETTYLADGKIMLFDVTNGHASHNLVMYLPEHKLLFSEDMFGSSYQTQFDSPTAWPAVDIYSRLDGLTNKINQLGLEVEQYLSSHHGRILSQAEIDEAQRISHPSTGERLKRLFPDEYQLN